MFYFKKQKQVLNYGFLWYTFIFQKVYVKLPFTDDFVLNVINLHFLQMLNKQNPLNSCCTF